MIRKFLLVSVMLGMLTGCVDTVDSVSREYRNSINECIDAMMMISTEAQAKDMITRVFKPSLEKFAKIDNKLKVFEVNRPTTFDFVKEVANSDGAHLFFSELEYNRQRFALEKTRLRHVLDDSVKRERELRIAAGEPNPNVTNNEICPKLSELLSDNGPLGPVESQLKAPNMMGKYEQNNARLKDDQKDKLQKIFEEKEKQFAKENIPQLVN